MLKLCNLKESIKNAIHSFIFFTSLRPIQLFNQIIRIFILKIFIQFEIFPIKLSHIMDFL